MPPVIVNPIEKPVGTSPEIANCGSPVVAVSRALVFRFSNVTIGIRVTLILSRKFPAAVPFVDRNCRR